MASRRPRKSPLKFGRFVPLGGPSAVRCSILGCVRPTSNRNLAYVRASYLLLVLQRLTRVGPRSERAALKRDPLPALFLPSVVEDGCSGVSFVSISPSLCDVILVVLHHGQPCIVPVVRRLQSGHAY